jgi:hypothetical protein
VGVPAGAPNEQAVRKGIKRREKGERRKGASGRGIEGLYRGEKTSDIETS